MPLYLTNTQKYSILYGISALAILSLFFIPTIPQNSTYHQFADQRKVLGIAHFLNAASNILFLISGLLGIKLLFFKKNINLFLETSCMHLAFFISIFFVGLGSGYYHLYPTNQTLIWDRLPMTVAFMVLFSIIISEFISMKLGKFIIIPLVILGLLSIAYWVYTEQQGAGDLRFYGLIQFLPMILIPLILVMFVSPESSTKKYWYLLMFYLLAKIFEMIDLPTYQLTKTISGHSLKHIFAGIGCYYYYSLFKKEIFRLPS